MRSVRPARLSTGVGRLAALVVVLALATMTAAGAGAGIIAAADTAPLDLSPDDILDGSNSADAGRLLDGLIGPDVDDSWRNAGNPWADDDYPMVATIDLGGPTDVTAIRYYAGQIPFPEQASLQLEGSATGQPGSFVPLATATNPTYDRWSEPLTVDSSTIDGTTIRHLRLSFDSMKARFNVAELSVEADTGTGAADGEPVDGNPVTNVTATDGTNSTGAARLLDGDLGLDDAHAWDNPNRWQPTAYPMVADFDLGRTTALTSLAYFVGNLDQSSAVVHFEYSPDAEGDNFTPLVTVDDNHRWSQWREIDLVGQSARRVRIRFDSPAARFNISEVVFRSDDSAGDPTAGPTITGHDHQTSTTTGGTVPPTEPDNPPNPPTGEQPQAGPPPAGIVRSHGFGNWPGDHLTQSCRDLHDSYWVQGPNAGQSPDPDHPDNRAYHTWHPALAVHPTTGERCDFGHEHGWDPTLAPADLFELSGGWPAFGYVTETMSGHRHEDHVGHKVTVARFRAAIGNGAGSEPMYDAGFECDWLSKIHQGSHSMDAFANHLHEYYLTLRCYDGLNSAGVVDNTVVGTEFSVKVMYTYGLPNEFVEDGCSRDDPGTATNETVFSASTLTGPEGQAAPVAHQETPIGTDSPNNRGFTCPSGLIWKDMSEIQQVDLWTQLVEIQGNDGQTALTIQPYYIIKNPARVVADYDGAAGERPSQVIRTIGLCYDDAGTRLQRPFCAGAPEVEPDWQSPDSPFNGTLRAVNFKSSHVANGGGPSTFCTTPAGRAVQDLPPCDVGNVTQTIMPFDNHWNDGQYRFGGNGGNIQGSIWAEDPFGRRFEAAPAGGGAYTPNGVGFEFIIDNRNPDDDGDGQPDGANIRAVN